MVLESEPQIDHYIKLNTYYLYLNLMAWLHTTDIYNFENEWNF